MEQAEGPSERVSPAIIAENSNKKPGVPFLGVPVAYSTGSGWRIKILFFFFLKYVLQKSYKVTKMSKTSNFKYW